MFRNSIFVFSLAVFLFQVIPVNACTTMLVTKGATEDGSVFVAHSDDDELGDQRIVYVPAKDHKPGTMRPVFFLNFLYPRIVTKGRGPGYDTPGFPETRILGYIKQVPHTYAYFDGNYGIMNEHQLMIGECTDGAKFEPDAKPGERIFYSAELSRVALERCKKAKDAVKLMGELLDKFGYYGTGETLLVADTEEGWVFEMTAGSKEGKEALWVAKKVPDGEVFVAANEFRIREVDPEDPDMLYSKNLHRVAQKNGWWTPSDGNLDWLKTVSHGEYNHPYYSLRRVWRIMSRLAPSLKLSPWVKDGYTKAYPFSVKPDRKIKSPRDIMALYRDHYEGTEFDMTKGLAAGPYSSPTRYLGKYDGNQNDVGKPGQKMWGAWERPISVFYCGYSYVCQARGWMPDPVGGVMWLGLDVPYTTCYMPFYCGVNQLPENIQTGSTEKFDRDVAWWAFNFVGNWVELKFSYMKKDVQARQNEIEEGELTMLSAMDSAAMELYNKDSEAVRKYLTDKCLSNSGRVVKQWWELGYYLIEKYSDGYINKPKIGQETGYPKAWLQKVGYQFGPTSYQKQKKNQE